MTWWPGSGYQSWWILVLRSQNPHLQGGKSMHPALGNHISLWRSQQLKQNQTDEEQQGCVWMCRGLRNVAWDSSQVYPENHGDAVPALPPPPPWAILNSHSDFPSPGGTFLPPGLQCVPTSVFLLERQTRPSPQLSPHTAHPPDS